MKIKNKKIIYLGNLTLFVSAFAVPLLISLSIGASTWNSLTVPKGYVHANNIVSVNAKYYSCGSRHSPCYDTKIQYNVDQKLYSYKDYARRDYTFTEHSKIPFYYDPAKPRNGHFKEQPIDEGFGIFVTLITFIIPTFIIGYIIKAVINDRSEKKKTKLKLH